MIVTILAIGCLLLFFVWGLRAAAFAKKVHQRMEDFSAIMMSIESWNDQAKSMPNVVCRDAFGRPCYSWRCQIVGWLDDRYPFADDVPWYDPSNIFWQDRWVPAYCSSLDGDGLSLDTTVWAVSGRDTGFDSERPWKLSELPGSLILLIEIRNSGIRWLEPGDLDVNAVPKTIVEGTGGYGVIVAFADGSVWYLDRSVPLDTLKKFFTIDESQRSDRDKLLGPFRRDSRQ